MGTLFEQEEIDAEAECIQSGKDNEVGFMVWKGWLPDYMLLLLLIFNS